MRRSEDPSAVKSLMGEMLGMLETAFGYFTTGGDLSPVGSHNCSQSEGHPIEPVSNGTHFRHSAGIVEATSPPLKEDSSSYGKEGEEALAKVPPSGPLGYLLAVDGQVTMAFALYFAHPVTRLQRFVYLCCKVLEISGHGVPWFFLSFFLICLHYLTEEPVYLQYGLNILLVLIVDIITVAPAKLIFKRPRPSLNEGPIPMSMSQVDQYAFPSGHASRCVALAAYFCYMPPFNSWTHLWYLWGLLVSLSRITLGRHHVLDVIAGMGAGLIIFELVKWPNLLQGVS